MAPWRSHLWALQDISNFHWWFFNECLVVCVEVQKIVCWNFHGVQGVCKDASEHKIKAFLTHISPWRASAIPWAQEGHRNNVRDLRSHKWKSPSDHIVGEGLGIENASHPRRLWLTRECHKHWVAYSICILYCSRTSQLEMSTGRFEWGATP